MPSLRKLLAERHRWYEENLERLAALDGYGDLSKPLVEFLALLGRDKVRLTDLATKIGASRQWALRLANEGKDRGLLELSYDPNDKRALMVGFSDEGWKVVKLAVARMTEIEEELSARIGLKNFNALLEILSMEWERDQGRQDAKDEDRVVL